MPDVLTTADIAEADGGKIVDQAVKWGGTLYAPNVTSDKYKGAGAEMGKEADCSGSVWKIYCNAGYPYDYTTSTAFDTYSQRPNSPFRKLSGGEAPQRGDVVLYQGHMSVYAGHSMVWSAHKTGQRFAMFGVTFFSPLFRYYRYQISVPAKAPASGM
jgi:cell wall-associated NlpC family hydrolase